MFTHNPQVRNTFPREKGRAININNLCKRVFPCFQYPWVPEASSGDLQESPSPWSGGWRMGRSKDPGGSPAGPRPLDQGAPSLVTQSSKKGCSGELLANLWGRACLPPSPRAFLSSGALPKDSPPRWLQSALQGRTGSSHHSQHRGKAGTPARLPGSPVPA